MFRFGAWNTIVLLGRSQQEWVRSAGTSLFLSWLQHWVGWEGASFWCVVHFLSVWYTCITSIGVGFRSGVSVPDTSVGWETFLFPVYCRNIRLVTAHTPHLWKHLGIQQCMWDLSGFSGSVLTCQKHPHSVLRVAQEIWEGAEMSQTGGVNHWPIFLTLSPGRHWKSIYLGWLIPSKYPN